MGEKILIDQEEFQQKILNYISSDELDKMIDNTVFKDKPECKSAIIHGMVFVSILTCKCSHYWLKDDGDSN